MKIALCLSMKDATTGQLRSKEYCSNFVGAKWIPEFIKLANEQGHEVLAGRDVTSFATSEFHVIQEDRSPVGRKLIKLGATPLINFCAESPLYVPSWYDQLDSGYSTKFKHVVTTKEVCFPSFDAAEPRPEPIPWRVRRPFVMVASNKYYRYTTARRLQRKMSRSKAWKHAVENQLQDKRYEAITHLKNLDLLDLYGHGWPPGIASAIADKASVMPKYRFAVCFENVVMEGYMTEKIIDCFRTGVIPIYLGDPCINMRVPKGSFIDFRRFSGWDECRMWTSYLTESMARDMIKLGQMWLQSREGLRWTYKGFAQKILQLCLETSKETTSALDNSTEPLSTVPLSIS